MEDYKRKLESLLERLEWFNAFCAPCDNGVSYEFTFCGVIYRFSRDEHQVRTVDFRPFAPFGFPEEEQIALMHKDIFEKLIAQKTSIC